MDDAGYRKLALHNRLHAGEALIAYCHQCEHGMLVTERNWEPEVDGALCLSLIVDNRGKWQGEHGYSDRSYCQCEVWIVWNQDAAETAYHLGGWKAVTELVLQEMSEAYATFGARG